MPARRPNRKPNRPVADLPTGLMWVHWLGMLATGATLLVGFATRWRHTAGAMAACYAGLVAICAVETFAWLQNDSRYANSPSSAPPTWGSSPSSPGHRRFVAASARARPAAGAE